MTTSARPTQAPFGELLRQWRAHRRLSQLDLSSETAISTRHLSFVETGRAQPSRELVLRISEYLDIPLRDRNQMLLAAGFAPAFPEHDLDAPEMASARAAVREVLDAHNPYPALAVDRTWNIVDANAAVSLLTQVASPELLDEQPLNALRLTLHPRGMAPHIRNLSQWRSYVLGALRRDALARADAEMLALHDELAAYPAPKSDGGQSRPAAPNSVHVPLQLRVDGTDLSFLAIIASFGTAVDVRLSELAIEMFFPSDDATTKYLQSRSGTAKAITES